MCDQDFTVRFFNPAIGVLIERAQTKPARIGVLDGSMILQALGVDDCAVRAEIATKQVWWGIVPLGAPRGTGSEGALHVAVETFCEPGSPVGWLITAREHADRAIPARLSDRELIILSDKLTLRERDVVLALEEGASNKAIAQRLNISPRTVEFHRARVMQRFGAKSVIDLIRKLVADAGVGLR